MIRPFAIQLFEAVHLFHGHAMQGRRQGYATGKLMSDLAPPFRPRA
jgi:hypothetical protein